MTIKIEELVALVESAGRLVGIQELLRAGSYHQGQQTELKRVLRDLVRGGRLTRDGKRFGVPGASYNRKSGPAWSGKPVKVQKVNPVAGEAMGRPTAPERPGHLQREPGRRPGGQRPRPPAPVPVRMFENTLPAAEAPRPERQGKTGHQTRGELVEGIINHHPDGFAFVKSLVGGRKDDIFIPPDEAKKALDHDQVLIELVTDRGRTVGKVVEVRSRTRQLVVGVYVEERDGAWVEPREAELGRIRVPRTQLARPGDAVKVRLGVGTGLFRNDRLVGEVAGSLGSPDDHSVEVLAIAFAKGFHDEFPPAVMDEADRFEVAVAPHEAKSEKRKDLRELPLVTIDGEDARDFDDAIYVEDRDGGWRLVVAIADVSHYVQEGSALDAEALRRATSVYLPGRVLPMLPERLSNGICSLKPDEDRLCMVADMVIDGTGRTVSSDVYPGVMRSQARCTYTEVHDVLAGKDVPGRTRLKPLFERLDAMAKTLTRMRVERGAIEFDLPETRVELGPDGMPLRMVRRERWESHRLVEESMLAANEAVARFFRDRGLPTVNRYHGEPDEEKLATFIGLLRAYGVPVQSETLTSKELNEILQKLEGHPEQRSLHQLALRSMMQAVYSVKSVGHYGLGAEDYLHFTSPIRRYPDLLVHRLLKEFWGEKKKLHGPRVDREVERLEALAAQSSERERAAMQVEREVSSLYACLLMRDRVGEEFDATVSGLSENGFYVTLDEHWVDGLVRGETVYPSFELDTATYRLVFNNGLVVKVGQKVRVRLESVNLRRKQMDFEALELQSAEPAGSRPRKEPGESRGRREERQGRGRGGERGRGPGEARSNRFGGRRQGGEHGGREARTDRGRRGRGEVTVTERSGNERLRKAAVKAPPSPTSEAPRNDTGFDARKVLDRLRAERGGKQMPARHGDKPRGKWRK